MYYFIAATAAVGLVAKMLTRRERNRIAQIQEETELDLAEDYFAEWENLFDAEPLDPQSFNL